MFLKNIKLEIHQNKNYDRNSKNLDFIQILRNYTLENTFWNLLSFLNNNIKHDRLKNFSIS